MELWKVSINEGMAEIEVLDFELFYIEYSRIDLLSFCSNLYTVKDFGFILKW